jgi:hypothetical protein
VRARPFIVLCSAAAALTLVLAAGRAPAQRLARHARRSPTPQSVLSRLHAHGALTEPQYLAYRAQLRSARRALRGLRGERAVELGAVLGNLDRLAAAGQMTAPRLAPLFLTLERNTQWWTHGRLLAYGDRVAFKGSRLVWEYYPGQGIELQPLASFGAANGLYDERHYAQMQQLLAQLIALAVPRAGGLAWEYYFSFDGGAPPWISAMAQGTALQALGRAYHATGDALYLRVGHRALAPLRARPPAGLSVPTRRGLRFLQYSFAPGDWILNAFLQTLIGLHEYAKVTHDPVARALFDAGNAEAEHETPSFNTGAWSLYQPGLEDTLSYHDLVTGLLEQMCGITHARVYCRTAADFRADLKTAPVLRLLTVTATARSPFALAFSLSKISHVGVVVLRGARTVFLTSAQFPYGRHTFAVPALAAGRYTVRLAATDLAGNFARVQGTLRVLKRSPRRGPRRRASRRERAPTRG